LVGQSNEYVSGEREKIRGGLWDDLDTNQLESERGGEVPAKAWVALHVLVKSLTADCAVSTCSPRWKEMEKAVSVFTEPGTLLKKVENRRCPLLSIKVMIPNTAGD